MDWKDNFKEGKELVLATCSDNKPNVNIAMSLGFVDNKLIIADCQMDTTIKNLKQNKIICILSGYYRAKGTAEIESSGKYFKYCVDKNSKYKVRHAVVINIDEVFDLDNVKRIV